MAGANAQQAAQMWAQNLASAGQKITNGVNNTTKDPIQLAIAAIPTMVANFQAAASQGRIQSGLQKSSKAAWQQAMIKKGIPNLAAGTAQAMPKVAAKLQSIIASVNQAVAQLPPRGTLQQNLQRANQFATAMAATKGQH
jgi:hypothetical protein